MESGITTNIFFGDFLRFLQIESILVSQKIPPFSLFLFPFWEFFSFSFYTPTTMVTGPEALVLGRLKGGHVHVKFMWFWAWSLVSLCN